MSWTEVKALLFSDIDDVSGEVMFRAAARAVTQLSAGLGPTRMSGEKEAPNLIVLMRGLMTARATLDVFDVETNQAALRAGAAIDRLTSAYSYVGRTIRGALTTAVPSSRNDKEEVVRRALQSARDLAENDSRMRGMRHDDAERIDVWRLATNDIVLIRGKVDVPPPFEVEAIKRATWRRFESELKAMDESWETWLMWLRYRLFGIVSPDVPYQVWARVERSMALRDDYFWSQSPIAINVALGAIVLDETERLLDEESTRTQSGYGVLFEVPADGTIDVLRDVLEPVEAIRSTVVAEARGMATALLADCDVNSAARLRDTVSSYLDAFDGAAWEDAHILVARGDYLRQELASQDRVQLDPDVPALRESTLRLLSQTVRTHNLLVNSHRSLAEIDKLLLGPDAAPAATALGNLRSLIASAGARDLVSKRAAAVLNETREILGRDHVLDRPRLRATITGDNFVRTTVGYLWKHRGKLTVGSALGGGYAIAHWLVANEQIILGYLTNRPLLLLLVRRLLEFLHTLPVL